MEKIRREYEHTHYDVKAVGQAIRAARRTLGITQIEMADRAGMDRSYIGRIERGEVHLSLDKLYRIAEALGCTIQELLPEQ